MIIDNIIRKLISPLPAKIQGIYLEHSEIWIYLTCGGISMLISILTQYAMIWIFNTRSYVNTAISWLFASYSAFILNRSQVFDSSAGGARAVLQALAFFASRFILLVIEMLFMHILVDRARLNEYIMKLAAQAFIVIINYVTGRLIFKAR